MTGWVERPAGGWDRLFPDGSAIEVLPTGAWSHVRRTCWCPGPHSGRAATPEEALMAANVLVVPYLLALRTSLEGLHARLTKRREMGRNAGGDGQGRWLEHRCATVADDLTAVELELEALR